MVLNTISPYPTFAHTESFEHKKWMQLLGDEVRKFYNEGTWTPRLSQLTSGTVTATYTNQVGRWWKVGNLVTVTCTIVTSAFVSSAVQPIAVVDLPFPVDTTAMTYPIITLGSAEVDNFNTANWYVPCSRISTAQTTAAGEYAIGLIKQTADGTAGVNWVHTNEFAGPPVFVCQISYPTFP